MLRYFFAVFLLSFTIVNGAALQKSNNKNAYVEAGNGRPLLIKAYPAIENYQSDLYEVYAQPYNFGLHPVSAIAILQSDAEGSIKGEIEFIQRHPVVGPTEIRGNITGLPAGKHGLHIHFAGDLREGCDKLGPHFNPYQVPHGGPFDPLRHAGDLGNIKAEEDGTARIDILVPSISLLGGARGVVGRAIAITTNPDDLGKGGTRESVLDGDSGKPLACGVIAFTTFN